MCSISYRFGGLNVRIEGERLSAAVAAMRGFEVFEVDEAGDADVIICESNEPPAPGKEIYRLEHEGVTTIFAVAESDYVLQMCRESGERLLLWCSHSDRSTVELHGDFHPQMLRFALWVGYGMASVDKRRIAFHGSCVVVGGRAYMFLGESGTGKSTHARLWREHIAGAELLNDDSPIIVVEEGRIMAYGSPWSGKTPCYRQEKFPLVGFVRLSQAPFNKIGRLNKIQAYAAMHPSCPPIFAYDEVLYDEICRTLNSIVCSTPVYRLACLPDCDAAVLSFSTLSTDADERN